MNKEEIKEAFTLFLSGAGQMKNKKEMKWDFFDWRGTVAIEFVDGSSKKIVVRIRKDKKLRAIEKYTKYKLTEQTIYRDNGKISLWYGPSDDGSHYVEKHYNIRSGKMFCSTDFLKGGMERVRTWDSKGKLIKEHTEKNDRIIGEEKEWYGNGQIKYCRTNNPKTTWCGDDYICNTEWYSNGQMSYKKDDKKIIRWDNKGNKLYESYEKNGWLITKSKKGYINLNLNQY
ncbi:MAG: hypothetical protein WC523_04115 [Patescibacteria group bacterium]